MDPFGAHWLKGAGVLLSDPGGKMGRVAGEPGIKEASPRVGAGPTIGPYTHRDGSPVAGGAVGHDLAVGEPSS